MQKWEPTGEHLAELLSIWRRCKAKAEREKQYGMIVLATDWVEHLEALQKKEAP